jgi:hypothetical protein
MREMLYTVQSSIFSMRTTRKRGVEMRGSKKSRRERERISETNFNASFVTLSCDKQK